ncbi:glutamate ABC transporter substrate-binding protein [Micromonospora sp. WMMD558]|uniref:glutamate ABC transporter substrate-binding protein n=1 Tax=unclassified Micromonospora TaxID=2617518 RepID=UPI0012B4DDEA|nr:glutamate ABC transporter substrate-binding protein [Micromonospora sp. WMMC415]QGN50701.1 transporter substrate-binding domain-containing protein [Micromonospora sp. WMMC415]
MRVTRAAVVVVAALSFATGACGGDDSGPGVIEKATETGTLAIGVIPDQPGLSLKTDGTYVGFDVEIGKIVAKGLGVDPANIQWKDTSLPDREQAIKEGVVDFVIAAYTINAARKKEIRFAGPYYVAGQDLLVRADSTIRGPEELEGKVVCSNAGSTSARRIRSQYPNTRLQQYDQDIRCLADLESGAVDAVSTDDVVLLGYSMRPENVGKFKLVGKTFSEEPYGIGLKKKDKAGCERINEILKTAARNGSYEAAWEATLGKGGKPVPTLDVSKMTHCSA